MKLLLIAAMLLFSEIGLGDVRNPVMFIGEAVLGATLGAPLSADGNSELISGITAAEVSATASFTCTTTDQAMTSITYSPALAGTYLVLFGTDFNSALSGVVVTMNFDIAGSAQTVSQRKFMPFAGGTLTAGSQRTQASLNSLITVTAGQTITVHCSTSSNTVTTGDAQMQVVRLF